MRARPFVTRLRVALTVFVIVSGPTFWLKAEESAPPDPPSRGVATMAGMRSLVPSLVAVGWEHFFLDIRENLGLSDAQSQQLYGIRQRFLAERDLLEKELTDAQLGLDQTLESDIVDSARIEPNLRKIAETKSAISTAHFKAVLEAINILEHGQHLAAGRWLKLRLELLQPRSSDSPLNTIAPSISTRLAALAGPARLRPGNLG